MAFQLQCKLCGDRYWNNERHECKLETKPSSTKPAKKTAPPKNAQLAKPRHDDRVVPLTAKTKPVKRKEKPSTERNRRWREANREKAREYQRAYMRKWRSEP